MTRRRVIRLAVVAALITTPLLLAAGPSGSRDTAGRGLRRIGPVPPGRVLTATLLLRQPGARRLDTAVTAMENPAAAGFDAVLTPVQIGHRFGLGATPLRALDRALRARGIAPLSLDATRTSLRVRGTAAALERLLGLQLTDYVDASAARVRLATGRVTPPAGATRVITGATGLDTRPLWRPADVPLGGVSPAAAIAAYDIAPLRAAGLDGQGQTVAIVSFTGYDPADLAAFDRRFGITGPAPSIVPVDGGSYSTSGEAALDVELVRAIAPAARIIVYEAPLQGGQYSDLLRRIVDDHRATTVSSSWGSCELGVPGSERQADARLLRAGVASGMSFFVASGDQGAYDCQSDDPADHRLSVDWPAASQDAIAVGGTRLALTPSLGYGAETAWTEQLGGLGGGGGVSRYDPRPSWQTGPGVLGPASDGHRQLPDVSADADQGTGWAIEAGGPQEVGGTSAAAPFWAGAMALIRQYAAAHGVPRLTNPDPAFYALAAAGGRPAPFHDVTAGANRYWRAAPGWDPATGLGSPDVAVLARRLTAYVRAHLRHGRR